jgi:hypothetical protein
MEGQIVVDQINDFLVDRFKMLSHMYDCAFYTAMDARREARARDMAEWDALDEESKTFLLDYLAGMKTTDTTTEPSPGNSLEAYNQWVEKLIEEYEWTPERIANRDRIVARMRKYKQEAPT